MGFLWDILWDFLEGECDRPTLRVFFSSGGKCEGLGSPSDAVTLVRVTSCRSKQDIIVEVCLFV